MAIFLVNRSDLHNFLTDFEQQSDLRIVITLSHLRALHEALRDENEVGSPKVAWVGE